MTAFNYNLDHSDQVQGINMKDNTLFLNDGKVLFPYREINLGKETLTYANESKFHLPSLEDVFGQPLYAFPASHLSAVVLPPIKKKREYEKDTNALGKERFATLKRPRPTASHKRTRKLHPQIPTSTDL